MPSPLVRIDDPQEGSRIGICAPTAVSITNPELESVVKVMWIGNLPMSSQSGESRKDDEEQNDNFEDTENVEEADTPLG